VADLRGVLVATGGNSPPETQFKTLRQRASVLEKHLLQV